MFLYSKRSWRLITRSSKAVHSQVISVLMGTLCSAMNETGTCDATIIESLVMKACEEEMQKLRRSPGAHRSPLLSAMHAPTVKIGDILGVPASWAAYEDQMEGKTVFQLRQLEDDQFAQIYDYCCRHRCDVNTFIALGIC